MSSAFPRPTISAANGCAIIAAFPLKRLHHRMRPVDADLVYTSTGQVALTILLENGGPMLIVELTRLLLQWLWFMLAIQCPLVGFVAVHYCNFSWIVFDNLVYNLQAVAPFSVRQLYCYIMCSLYLLCSVNCIATAS